MTYREPKICELLVHLTIEQRLDANSVDVGLYRKEVCLFVCESGLQSIRK